VTLGIRDRLIAFVGGDVPIDTALASLSAVRHATPTSL